MKEPVLTLLEYALLGLLRLLPLSGYDVQRLFATTPLAHFSSSPGAIYPALKRLEKRDLVQSTVDTSTELRPRRVYTLAEPGRTALEAWLRQAVTRQELISDGRAPILRFSLMEASVSRQEAIAYLRGYGGVLADYGRELHDHRPTAEAGGAHARLSLEHGIRGFQAQAEWADWAIKELQVESSGATLGLVRKRKSAPKRSGNEEDGNR